MIFNLEERKDLKKVEFTQKAVIEVLGYLKQLADIEDDIENKKEELLQKEREIADLRQCEFVSTILDFNKLSADNCRLRDSISDLESKLAESEEKKESYRLQNDEHHLQLLQFYSRLGVEAFGADIHEKALEVLMIMKEQLVEFEKVMEKYDCKSVKKLNGRLYRYDQYETKIFNMEEEIKGLKQQLAEKEEEIERNNKTIDGILDGLDDIENCEFCEKVATSCGFANCINDCSLCAKNYYNEMSFTSKNHQYKISFAVEQLEKVKSKIIERLNIIIENYNDELYDRKEYMDMSWENNNIERFIDNQIKQLKEQKL
jgi:hypothetical protein